jgi:hypothetical protein
MAELRTWQPKTEVMTRAGEDAEQWHDGNTAIEILQKGHYQGYEEDGLDDDQKKLRENSRKVWTANNTFLWDWDGMPANIKALAKHRQPNYMTQGIAEYYHAMLAPPLTATCGHRCVHARATAAYEQSRSINRLMAYHGHYWGPHTDYPEITPDNINHLLSLINRYGREPKYTCCRCHNAGAWFGLHDAHAHGVYQDSFQGLTSKQVFETKGHPKSGHLRMENGQWYKECASQAYYSTTVNERTVSGTLDTSHIGWHAGLARPRFRYRSSEYFGEYNPSRPQWYSNIRLADTSAVVSGLHNPKRFLCPNCSTAVKGLPAHLYWVARGLSNKAARKRQHEEFLALQGKGKRWLQNTSIDIQHWEKIGQLYGM